MKRQEMAVDPVALIGKRERKQLTRRSDRILERRRRICREPSILRTAWQYFAVSEGVRL